MNSGFIKFILVLIIYKYHVKPQVVFFDYYWIPQCKNSLMTNLNSSSLKWKQILGSETLESLDIPEHWLQFDPPSCSAHIVLGILYIIILIPGLFGNGSIIWLFYK